MPDFCFILSCHNMVAELLAHLDILSFCPVPHDVIVVYSGPHDIKHLVEPAHYTHIEPSKHSLGALLALTRGIRVAKEKGYHYICFRNGDDWIFNHSRVECILERMRAGYKLAGYNWLGRNKFNEFALNDLYFDLEALSNLDLDFWDKEFINKVRGNCEQHFSTMMKSVVTDKQIFRLEGRERWDGIGNVLDSNVAIPDNNRWFNFHWQLIGDHNEAERRKHWERLQPLIPYADRLVQKPLFKLWLDQIRVYN